MAKKANKAKKVVVTKSASARKRMGGSMVKHATSKKKTAKRAK